MVLSCSTVAPGNNAMHRDGCQESAFPLLRSKGLLDLAKSRFAVADPRFGRGAIRMIGVPDQRLIG